MRKQTSEDGGGTREEPGIDSTPDVALAQKVIAALVAEGLVSDDDGARINDDLAAGKLDSATWKLVLENQLEREARADEQQ